MSDRAALEAAVTEAGARLVDLLHDALKNEPRELRGTILMAVTMGNLLGLATCSPKPDLFVLTVVEKLVREAQDNGWLALPPPGAATVLVLPADPDQPPQVRH